MQREFPVEECAEINISAAYKYLEPLDHNKKTDSRVGTLKMTVGDEQLAVTLVFMPDKQKMFISTTLCEGENRTERKELVELDWTPCHFGDKRLWGICPGCADGRY